MSYYENITNHMGKQRFLVQWLHGGVPHFRKATELPQNLVSDRSLERICQAIENDFLIRTAEDLALATNASLQEAANTAPDLDVALSTIEGRDAMHRWVTEHQPLIVLKALGEAVSRLAPRIVEGKVPQAHRVFRLLLVLSFACFVPRGTDLLAKLAAILNCHEPRRMIEKLTRLAMKGEHTTIDKMNHIVLSDGCWGGWVSRFMEQAQSLGPGCWGRLVLLRQPVDPTLWNALWDCLLSQQEEVDGD